MLERHHLEHDRIALHHVVLVVAAFEGLDFYRLNKSIKFLFLVSLKSSQRIIQDTQVLLSEGSDLYLSLGVKEKVNGTNRVGFNLSHFLLQSNILNDRLLDGLFNGLNGLKLVEENAALVTGNELLNLGVLKEFIAHLLQQPVLVVHLQLILEL